MQRNAQAGFEGQGEGAGQCPFQSNKIRGPFLPQQVIWKRAHSPFLVRTADARVHAVLLVGAGVGMGVDTATPSQQEGRAPDGCPVRFGEV